MSKESIDDVRRRVRRIIHVGERLPPDIRRDVIEADADAIPALIEILENRELSLETAPGDGWAPAHAARLLGVGGLVGPRVSGPGRERRPS